MKKVLICVLALVICLSTVLAIVGCDNKPSEGLEAAKNYLDALCKDQSSVSTADYTLVGSVPYNGATYEVSWSVKVTSGPANGVKLVPDGKLIKVDIDEYCAEEIKYTLTAEIKEEKASLTLSYDRSVPAFIVNTYDEYAAACAAKDDTNIIIKGFVVGYNASIGEGYKSSSAGSLWIQDENGKGYYAYKPTLDEAVLESRESVMEAFPMGSEVIVRGTCTTYGGCYEFNSGCTVESTGRNASELGVTLDYVDRTDAFAAITDSTDALIPFQSTRVALNNVILGEVDGKNYHFTVGGVDYICYIDQYIIDPDTVDALKAKWEVGAKANLKGVINVYSGKYQVYPDSIDSVTIVNEELTDAQKVERAKGLLDIAEKVSANFELPLTGAMDTTVAWAVKAASPALSIGEDGKSVTVTQQAEETVVTLVATIKAGEATDTKEFNVTVLAKANGPEDIVNAAYALEQGATLDGTHTLTGVVTVINYAYSADHKNITVTIVVAGLTDKPIECYRMTGDGCDLIAVGDTITVTGTIKNYNGKVEFDKPTMDSRVAGEGGGDVGGDTPSTPTLTTPEEIVNAAYALETGATLEGTYTLTGVVTTVGEYNTQYNDITCVIVVGNMTDKPIECYALKGENVANIAVGDTITVTGTIKNYKGKVEFDKPTLVSRVAGEGGSDTPVEPEPPTDPVEMTVAEALEAADGTVVIVSGTVSSVSYAWSDKNQNMSIVLSSNGSDLAVYKLATHVYLGDQVTVTGEMATYNNARQIGAGATAVVTVAHTCDYSAADCLNPATCKNCGAVQTGSEALGHIDEDTDGACDRCSYDLGATTATLVVADYATANGWANGVQYSSATVDSNITVTVTGGGNTGKYYDSGTNWRIYQNETPSIVVTAAEGKTIVSVKVTYVVQNTGVLTLDGEPVESDAVVEVNGSTVTFSVGNTGDAENGQVRITAIEVIYK